MTYGHKHMAWTDYRGEEPIVRWQKWFAVVPIKTRDMGWIWLKPYWVHRTEYWAGMTGSDRYTDKLRYATPLGKLIELDKDRNSSMIV